MKRTQLFQTPNRHPLMLVWFAILCLFILAVHSAHFHDRNYRQDEAWRVHAVLSAPLDEAVIGSISYLDPPLWLITLDAWVAAFGHAERITRFSSTLFTALALAFTFRLASDLFDQRIGLLAVFLLGTLAFFQFYMHETRPYALLALSATAAQLCLLRWLRHRDFRHALAFVLAGIATIYTHFYGLFFMAALALYVVLAVRWQRDLYLRAFGLFVAIGLSFLGWILPFIHTALVIIPGGISYALEPTSATLLDNLSFLYGQMNIRPPQLGHVILILGLVVPLTLVLARPQARVPFRFGANWPRVQALAVPAILLTLGFTTNLFVSSLTPRNLVVILPSLAILAAIGLGSLHWRAQWVLAFFIALTFVQSFRSYIANGPYHEIAQTVAAEYAPGDRVVIDAEILWQHVPINYYLRERMPQSIPNADIFHIMTVDNPAMIGNMPEQPAHLTADAQPEALAQFEDFIDSSDQVWFIEAEGGNPFHEPYFTLLDAGYLAVSETGWNGRQYPPHRVLRYRRIPADLTTRYTFGTAITLQGWQLRHDMTVQPCQTVQVDSWWQANPQPTENYNLTLALAGQDGVGIASSDGTPANTLMQQWQPSQLYLDERHLTIPCDTPPGAYNLLTGLYNFENGDALPAALPDGSPVGDLLYLTTLTVES